MKYTVQMVFDLYFICHFFVQNLSMKILSILTTLLLMSIFLFAQKDPNWEKKFPSKINWYRISDAGTLVVATKDGLYGLNPSTGAEIWKNDEIENIQESNYDPIEGTPYVALSKTGLLKSTNNILDVVTGKVVANSRDLGLTAVTKRIYLLQSNKVIFYGSGKKGLILMLVDLSTGQKVWEQEKLFNKNSEQIVSQANEVSDGIFIATDKNIYKLNKQSGEILYSIKMKSDLPVAAPEKTKGFGGMFPGGKGFDKAAGQMATLTSADFFQYENKNVIYFWNQDYLTCFNVADGKELWERFELPSPIAYILQDSHGMLVATAEKTAGDIAKANQGGGGLVGKIKRSSAGKKNRAQLLCLDENTGKEKWADGVDLQGDVLCYKLSGNKLILGTQRDQGTNFISIVDLDAGKSISKKALSVKGTVKDLQLVPQGLYFRTTDQINILDLESGEKTWAKGFAVKNCVGQNKERIGYVYAKGTIYMVDYEKGDLKEWVSSIKLVGDEEPDDLQVRDNGILITSNQNAILYDYSGKEVYKTYQRPPGRTMAGKILSGLGGLASAAMAAEQMAESAQLSYAKGYYGSTSPSLDNKIKNANANAVAFSGAAAESFRSISKRFNATKQANNYIAMLTNFGESNMAKDAGLMIIDKTNGKEIRKMILGDKKDPDYKIDELGRVVYYKSNGTEIAGFTF